jgi:hypothetical protein
MKTMRALTLPLLFALTACGASTFPSVDNDGSLQPAAARGNRASLGLEVRK